MSSPDSNTYEQVYNAHENDTLYAEVESVICVIIQRGLFIAGFGSVGLLTIHYYNYNNNKPVYDVGFYEHLFAGEPLLAAREKVKAVFIGGQRNLVVPDELFDTAQAAAWLRKLYFIEAGDTTLTFPLENDKAHYITAIPVNIGELVKINFKKAALLPLAIHHFNAAQVQSLYLQCCLANGQVVATLHNYSQLLWHKTFDYSCAEDIAYEIKLLCRENYIDAAKLNIVCNAISALEYQHINELTQYFSGIKAGNGQDISSLWDPAISLATQLLECV